MFSVIIPCFNIESNVSELLDMFKSDRFYDYEVIFVDDCSTDNTYLKLSSLSDLYEKFRIFQTPKNGGPGAARNIGLKNAKGDYVMFCDSDDIFEIDILSEIETFIAEHNPDLIVFPYTVKREKDNLVDEYDTYKHGETVKSVDVAADSGTSCAKLYKRKIIERNDIEFLGRMSGEDKVFVVNFCIHANSIYKYSKPYYTYIMRQGSITHTMYKPENVPTTFELLHSIYEEHYPEIVEKMFAETYLLTYAKRLTAAKSKNSEIKKFYKRANKKYPEWIKHIDYEKQSLYRKLIFKAMFKSKPLTIKFIMWLRRQLY